MCNEYEHWISLFLLLVLMPASLELDCESSMYRNVSLYCSVVVESFRALIPHWQYQSAHKPYNRNGPFLYVRQSLQTAGSWS